jgi:hypothetical protein
VERGGGRVRKDDNELRGNQSSDQRWPGRLGLLAMTDMKGGIKCQTK